jgi:signal transduction histidine kinase/CheY-like chemotaxis protein
MLTPLVSKYSITDILETDDSAYAITDLNYRITWYNEEFKSLIDAKRIRGKSLAELLEIDKENLEKALTQITKHTPLRNEKQLISITPLLRKGKTGGYFFKVQNIKQDTVREISGSDLIEKNLSFQVEQQNILSLIVKEKSLANLAGEILNKSIELSKSDFGVVVIFDEGKKYEYITRDNKDIIRNPQETKREIGANFSFITKWLNVNKHSLLALNYPNNIGFNLTRYFQCESLIVSPAFFDERLLAAIIVGRKKEVYSTLEINNSEQLAVLLAFAISSIKTRELNTTLENRLLQAQKLETIGKLSSGMAHDFSNLLSSIFGSLNLLKKRVPENENIYRLIDNIENCSVRARDLTKGLLSFGKPTPKRKEVIKPNSLMNEISKVILQTFPQKITFKSNIETNLYDVLGNGTEVYQVLLNLCVNAKEAIEGRGEIALRASNITIDEVNIFKYPLLNKGNYVHFSVTDNGVGIEEENLQKIFDPYFSTKIKETGSGLGLYVTYGIIKAHNGHVEVSSIIGKGTTFDVYLPAYEPAVSERQAQADKIILLVDDEIMLRDLLAEMLESNGYNVIKVGSGLEALKVLTEEIKVDLAIIDYNMPDINGLETIQKIRELKFTMPVILSSGSTVLEENLNLKDVGKTAILSKPYEFDTMFSTIQKLI